MGAVATGQSVASDCVFPPTRSQGVSDALPDNILKQTVFFISLNCLAAGQVAFYNSPMVTFE